MTAPPSSKKLHVVLLYGGPGGEHDVSRLSAASIFRHLDRSRYEVTPVGVDRSGVWYRQGPWFAQIPAGDALPIETRAGTWLAAVPGQGLLSESAPGLWQSFRVDVVFNIVHGIQGEDGRLQGLLETAGLPATGARVTGSALGMDKVFAKQVWEQHGLPVVPYRVAHQRLARKDAGYIKRLFNETVELLGLPLFVKPANSGSSVGVSKAHDFQSFVQALEVAFAVDEKVLVEQAMNVQEVEVAVLDCPEPTAFGPGEIEPTHEFYDYDAKYLDPQGARLLIPAHVSPTLAETLLATAVAAYRALDVQGFSRVDFFVDKVTGHVYLNEINTLPGFTTISMFPRMAMSQGLSYGEVLDWIIHEAMNREVHSVGKS